MNSLWAIAQNWEYIEDIEVKFKFQDGIEDATGLQQPFQDVRIEYPSFHSDVRLRVEDALGRVSIFYLTPFDQFVTEKDYLEKNGLVWDDSWNDSDNDQTRESDDDDEW